MKLIQYVQAVIKLPDSYKKNNGAAKMLLILLLREKEEGRDVYCYDAFLESFPQYKGIEAILVKEGLIKQGRLNRLNRELIKYLSYIPKEKKIVKDFNSILRAYNNIWAGLMGTSSGGGSYRLLDTTNNKVELSKFIEEYPEFEEDIILEATKMYLNQLERDGTRYRYAVKSSNFINKGNLLEYCTVIDNNNKTPKVIGKEKYKGETYFRDL